MEHVVFSAAPGADDTDGSALEAFRRVASLEEAVREVEHLRNDLGIMDASVFALTPVPLAFRTYYRVEVPGVDVPAVDVPAVDVPAVDVPAVDVPAVDGPALEGPALEPLDELPLDELRFAEPALEVPEPLDAGEYSFDAATGMTVMSSELSSDALSDPVPALLPSTSAIPQSRQEGESEHSLGYFAR
jgi:hypothetical protein